MKFFLEEVKVSNEGDKLYITGWCFSEKSNERPEVVVEINGKVVVSISPSGYRPDVYNNFPGFPDSQKCGFNAALPLQHNSGMVKIIITDCGKVHTVFKKSVKVLKKEATQPGLDSEGSGFGYFKSKLMFFKVLLKYFRKAYQIIRNHGFFLTPAQLKEYFYKAKKNLRDEISVAKTYYNITLPEKEDPYQVWIKHNILSEEPIGHLKKIQQNFTYQPLISIVMPVWNVETKWLEKAIDSIRNQIYTNWELCIADDASTLPSVKPFLEEIVQSDRRIKTIFREENGNISVASNSAAEFATGEFIFLMDNDDEIEPHALFEVVRLLQDKPDADIIYSDDDKIDENGIRYAPQFKPDWSPELLLSYMYFSHLFCIRRSLFIEVGGFRTGFEGTQDYDLALRLTERTDKVFHIPKILYHWRAISGSTATSGLAKPEAFNRGIKAVQEAADRRNLPAKVQRPDFAVSGGLGIFTMDWPDEGPEVTVIIPTKNQLPLLKRCLNSFQKTTYKNYNIMIVDNMSDDPETIKFLNSISHRVERIPNPTEKFSYAYINNEAVKRTNSEMILFLNNDTEVINANWLSQMVGYMRIQGIGAVGGRLIFPDNRVQSAGIIIGLYKGMAGPAFKLLPEWDPGYLAYAKVARNYSALTAACLLVNRNHFLELGGFDQENFAVAYNDVDFCLRLMDKGFRLAYVPEALLKHYEGASRGFNDNPHEMASFRKKYKGYIDPYYNPNLSLENEQFEISTRCTIDYFPFINKKPKMLMVGFNLNLEGAPFSQYELTCGLVNRGSIDIEVYCPTDGPLRKYYEDKGVTVHVFDHPLSGVTEMDQYNSALKQFGQWMKNQNFDIVYGNTLQTFYVIEAANRVSLPTIWNIRESEPFVNYFNYLPPLVRHQGIDAFKAPYRIIFVAEATRKLFEALDARKTFTVIHNGLQKSRIEEYCQKVSESDARKIVGVPPNKKMVLIVGTVCPRKGQLGFTKAAIKLLKQGLKNVCFYIVGGRDSSYLTEIKDCIAEAKAEKDIIIVMETEKTYDYYRAADVFVCCSYNESYPRIILEAMAFGLPIVTTSVFGIKEQVMENVNALLFKPGDVNKLSEQLNTFLGNNDLMQRFSANSPVVLECITSYEEMVQMYESHMLGAWMTKNTKK